MFYRSSINGDFEYVEVRYRHTALLCGYRAACCTKDVLRSLIQHRVETIYSVIEEYDKCAHGFIDYLEPLETDGKMPDLIKRMCIDSAAADVGPMASVAGLVADEALKIILEHCESGFVENGGDVALHSTEELNITVFPGWDEESASIGFRVPAGSCGITTSSGKYGPSFSKGEADMVSVAAESAPVADAWSTSICNRIKSGVDVAELVESLSGLKAVAVMWKGQIWYKGDFELIFIK